MESSLICSYYIVLIHSSVNGNLGCFLILTVMNNVAVNICVQFCVDMLFFLLGRFLWVESLDCMVNVCLTFKETAYFPKWLFCLAFPPPFSPVCEGSSCWNNFLEPLKSQFESNESIFVNEFSLCTDISPVIVRWQCGCFHEKNETEKGEKIKWSERGATFEQPLF